MPHSRRRVLAAATLLVALAFFRPAQAASEVPESSRPPSPDAEQTPLVATPASPAEEAPVESAASRLLRESRQVAEADFAALRAFEASLQARAERMSAASTEATERVVELTASLRSLGDGPNEAEDLYDRIVQELDSARPDNGPTT